MYQCNAQPGTDIHEVGRRVSSFCVTCKNGSIGTKASNELGAGVHRLFVEKVEMGEEEPRTIISGLVNFQTEEQLQVRRADAGQL